MSMKTQTHEIKELYVTRYDENGHVIERLNVGEIDAPIHDVKFKIKNDRLVVEIRPNYTEAK